VDAVGYFFFLAFNNFFLPVNLLFLFLQELVVSFFDNQAPENKKAVIASIKAPPNRKSPVI